MKLDLNILSIHKRGVFLALALFALLIASVFPHSGMHASAVSQHSVLAIAIQADHLSPTQSDIPMIPIICKMVCSHNWVALEGSKLNLEQSVGPSERPPQSI